MVPPGITLGLKGPYVVGRRLEVADVTEWFVKAYMPSSNTKWPDDFHLNGGNDSKAFGIAISSSAVVAMGQTQNGSAGPGEAAVQSYKP